MSDETATLSVTVYEPIAIHVLCGGPSPIWGEQVELGVECGTIWKLAIWGLICLLRARRFLSPFTSKIYTPFNFVGWGLDSQIGRMGGARGTILTPFESVHCFLLAHLSNQSAISNHFSTTPERYALASVLIKCKQSLLIIQNAGRFFPPYAN